MLTTQFLTAGNAIFTVELPENFVRSQALLGNIWHPHYTFRVVRVELKGSADGRFPARVAFFVSSLTGPDNTKDYAYLGELNPTTGEVRLTAKSSFPANATRVRIVQRVLAAIFSGRGEQITAAGWNVTHNGYCGRCAAVLTTPASVESGFGPECYKNVFGCSQPKGAAAVVVVAAEPEVALNW